MRAMSLSRRTFMAGLAAGAFAARDAWAQAPSIDADALRRRIEALSLFGRPAGGTFADGVSRVAYSDADVGGRRYVIGLMKAAGLSPTIDPAGNIFARRAGIDASLRPTLFGSHIHSLPHARPL